MRHAAVGFLLMNCAGWLVLGQTTEAPPRFEAADVRVSPKSSSTFSRSSTARGRYQIKNGNMVDLIRAAYDFDSDKVLGGPNWLEMDRFDVVAKLPEESTPDLRRQMMQTLLAERFHLVVHKETKPMPAWALGVGKKLQIKQAEAGSEHGKAEESGCQPQGPVAGQLSGRVTMMNSSGAVTSFDIGPGGTVRYACRNISMAGFVEALRTMWGANLNQGPVLNETGLEGLWNFDLTYTGSFVFMGGDSGRISLPEAVDKQLGLKLEEKQVPTPVLVVDSVNQKPSPNPPGTAEALPAIPVPAEFEVASVKEAAPSEGGRGRVMRRFGLYAGGRFEAQSSPLSFLVNRAFNTNNRDQIVGMPAWADSTMFDITAKASVDAPSSSPMMDAEVLAPMLLNLLKVRFKLAYHTAERPASTYTLTATGKPRMKKADPASRIFCKTPQPPAGSPPMTRVLTCQNVTMAQLAERLQGMNQELSWPVADGTEIEGGWDFTLTFSLAMMPAMARGSGGDGGPGGAAVPTAAEPTAGLTIFEAVEKQLGLKLTMQKRPMQVIVIDHLEQKPTEN